MFSKRSKPKVLNFTDYQFNNNVESVNIKNINNSDLIRSNPDLIVSSISDQLTYSQLSKLSIHYRKRWVFLERIDPNNIFNITMFTIIRENNDLISVYTSAYKNADYIVRAYESLRNQSYQNWEWIIVDDTPDNDLIYHKLLKLADQDERVKVYQFRDSRSNGNIGEAKYRASMLCTGSICVELDHDDVLTYDALEYLKLASDSHPECGFFYSDCVEYNFNNGESKDYGDDFGLGYGVHYPYEYEGHIYYASRLTSITARSMMHIVGVPNHLRAWRTEVLRSLGYNRNMRIADDYELLIRTFLVTKFCHIPKMLYIQSWGDGNSQDADDNWYDIQRRTCYIANYYLDSILTRVEQLSGERPFGGWNAECIRMDRSELIALNETFNI